MEEAKEQILKALETKASGKQFIYRNTLDVYQQVQQYAAQLGNELRQEMAVRDSSVQIEYANYGRFESSLSFSGDTLFLMMHTNVFTFPEEHFLHKSPYVREDPMRAYCGMIMIYNFLADSVKYQRMNDMGYLIGRIFINKEGHFFTQGRRQFNFMFREFEKQVISPEVIQQMVDLAVLQAIDFDLYVPPFDKVKEMTLIQKIREAGTSAVKTGKRLGFSFGEESPMTVTPDSTEEL